MVRYVVKYYKIKLRMWAYLKICSREANIFEIMSKYIVYIMQIAHCTMYNLQYTVYILKCTIYNVPCTIYTVYTVYNVNVYCQNGIYLNIKTSLTLYIAI